jgi:exodeoxyribonuclease VII small subunit
MHSATEPTSGTVDTQQLPLGACLSRLTEINRRLSQGNIDVEAALTLFEEGVLIHSKAEQILQQARLRIHHLTTKAQTEAPEDAPLRESCGSESEDELPF